MSLMLTGVGIAKGVALGKAYVMKQGQTEIPEYEIPEYLLDEEIARFNQAIKQVREQLNSIREKISETTPEEITEFIESHILTLDENAISRIPARLIREKKINAEWALKQQQDNLAKVFDDIDEPYLNTRKNDVDIVVDAVLKTLKQQDIEPLDILDEEGELDRIIIADKISPSDLALLNSENLAGFVSEHDAPNSHTAIMARSLGIPAITGIGKARKYVQDGEKLILDGKYGTICVNPDNASSAYYHKLAAEIRRYKEDLSLLCNKPSVTKDGHKVVLSANIEMLTELEQMQKCGVEAIGLFRTEYLYMNRDELPDEEEQYQHYVELIEKAGNVPVNMRTLDIGADKQLPGMLEETKHANPMLGLRAIRFSLAHPGIFESQIRAILRAATKGQVGVILPLIGSAYELDKATSIIQNCRKNLIEQEVEIGEIKLGMMIETPAAVMLVEYFAKKVDFIAIGTNDLTQYMLAIDRNDDQVSNLFDSSHPAILRIINNIIQTCDKMEKDILVCGEMAGDKKFTRLLLGMGLRNFSMMPAQILEIKKHIRDSRIDNAELFINEILRSTRPERIEELIEKLNQ